MARDAILLAPLLAMPAKDPPGCNLPMKKALHGIKWHGIKWRGIAWAAIVQPAGPPYFVQPIGLHLPGRLAPRGWGIQNATQVRVLTIWARF